MKLQEKQSRMGFLLAGGRSSRMGTDKALLDFGGITLIERALTVLRAACPAVTIVCEDARFSAYATVVEDVYSGCGPLAGIHAALLHSSAELNLVLAVDMPYVSESLLRFLFATAEQSDAVVTVPHTGRGFQPLCAVYRRPFAAAAEQALRAGQNKVDALFSKISTRMVEASELEAAGFSDRVFVNLNTPADLRAILPGSVPS